MAFVSPVDLRFDRVRRRTVRHLFGGVSSNQKQERGEKKNFFFSHFKKKTAEVKVKGLQTAF